VGAVVCDLVDTGSKEQEADKEDILKQGLPLPLKLVQLETFFKDLETKYGTYDVHKQFASPRSMDIFMLCTRSEIRQQGLGTKLILQVSTFPSRCMKVCLIFEYAMQIKLSVQFGSVRKFCLYIAKFCNITTINL